MVADKKAETKNQHYVPQFYQRMFSGDVNHKTIGAYIISSRKYIPAAPIKNQSSGDYFYSDNQKIEDALGKMEEWASDVVKKIKTNPKCQLSTREEYILYCFTFILFYSVNLCIYPFYSTFHIKTLPKGFASHCLANKNI